MKICKYIIPTALTLMTLAASCSSESEEPQPNGGEPTPPPAEAYIQISGNTPSVAMSSRGGEPSVPGRCTANRIALSFYSAESSLATTTRGPEDFTRIENSLITEDLEEAGGENNRYKKYVESIKEGSRRRSYVAGRALAYTTETGGYDPTAERYFSYSPGEYFYPGGSRTVGSLTLTKYEGQYRTPEFYYGPLDFNGTDRSYNMHGDYPNQFAYWDRGLTASAITVALNCKGKIYRIVSQFNLIISNIPDIVTDLELVCFNYPTRMNLASSSPHGTYYPVDICYGSRCRDRRGFACQRPSRRQRQPDAVDLPASLERADIDAAQSYIRRRYGYNL